jgi:outer membrane lipoprotein-sorting protein
MTSINLDSMTKAIGFDGFPVQTTTKFGDGGRQIVVTLKSIQRQDPPADAFDIPAGYTKIDFASMGRLLAPE